ncbi:holin [Candidatus Pantoea alvi]|nr:holin [Pantoea alvi]
MALTQEQIQVAIALLLSVVSGIGAFLMAIRDGRLKGRSLDFVTELFVAVTAGMMAYLIGQHQKWEVYITYLSVLLASNNGHEVMAAVRRFNLDMLLNGLTNLFKKGGGK